MLPKNCRLKSGAKVKWYLFGIVSPSLVIGKCVSCNSNDRCRYSNTVKCMSCDDNDWLDEDDEDDEIWEI